MYYNHSSFYFSATAAEKTGQAIHSSRPGTTPTPLMEQDLKGREEKWKQRKAMGKAGGRGPPPLKKPKSAKFTHGAVTRSDRKVSPNNHP